MRYLGLDTSNYTTSVAIYDGERGTLVQKKQLLPVPEKALGLRQSDAVFFHTRQLPLLLEQLAAESPGPVDAVGVSARPRDMEGSYMPCFLCGEGFARGYAALNRLPLYSFSHQAGHIMAALYSCGRLDLADREFLAFHVSGGTTEALHVSPDREHVFRIEQVAASLDLKAGQAIDRVGVLLSLPFPAGKYLDKLSHESRREFKVRPVMRGADCSLSGIQNACEKLFAQGSPPCDVAKYCIQAVQAAIVGMTRALRERFPGLPLVYAGGVMSNTMIRAAVEREFGGLFAAPEFSCDNTAGAALLAARHDREKGEDR